MKFPICSENLKGKPKKLQEFAEALEKALNDLNKNLYLYVQSTEGKTLTAFVRAKSGRLIGDYEAIISQVLKKSPEIEKKGNVFRVVKGKVVNEQKE